MAMREGLERFNGCDPTHRLHDRDIDLNREMTTRRSDRNSDDSLYCAVESNARLLELLLEQFTDLREQIVDRQIGTIPGGPQQRDPGPGESEACDRLQQQIAEYQDRIAELERQTDDLASQIANKNVRQTVACVDSGSSDALSWEDRKKLILQQMETDSFDAESFIENLQAETSDTPIDPVDYVQQIHAELSRKSDELKRRDDEIRELQCLLEQRPDTRDADVAIGAAAIAEMVDADELVQQERARLKQLQTEWEEKFRQGEIEASLERAKSRAKDKSCSARTLSWKNSSNTFVARPAMLTRAASHRDAGW